MTHQTTALVLLATLACAGPSGTGRITLGPWGGEHVLLTVKDTGADVQFDCAHGRVEEPIVLDDAQRFDVRGVFIREHGGPVKKDEAESSQPVRYKGTVNADRMSLTVAPEGGGEDLGSFTLSKGSKGHLVRCY